MGPVQFLQNAGNYWLIDKYLFSFVSHTILFKIECSCINYGITVQFRSCTKRARICTYFSPTGEELVTRVNISKLHFLQEEKL